MLGSWFVLLFECKKPPIIWTCGGDRQRISSREESWLSAISSRIESTIALKCFCKVVDLKLRSRMCWSAGKGCLACLHHELPIWEWMTELSTQSRIILLYKMSLIY